LPSSPANVLKNVATAFNIRDINLLKAMLSENFVFYFDPDDVGQYPPGGGNYKIPESWSYMQFWTAISNLFVKAYAISFTIPAGETGTPGPNESPYKADNINIKLLVYVDELNGYLVDGGYCNFEFEKYRSEAGADRWRLTKWWDNTSVSYDANPRVSPTSVGRVFALFY
jgi:hypothetical protein